MNADRRDCLKLGLLTGAGTLLTGCSKIVQQLTAPALSDSLALPVGNAEPVVRLVNRLAFGPVPGEIERVSKLGAKAYVEEQLNPEDGEELKLAVRLRGIDALHGDPMEMRDLPDYEVLRGLQQAAILWAVYSRHQLRERLVDFWSNHFNIYAYKGWAGFFKPQEELSVIREHALGTFPELLRASAHSPAMLSYLDNEVNARGVPNENYARELMELHTLGVHGGYTQKDVQEVARCLTGWTVENRFLHRRGTFRFDDSRHDNASKTVLGVHIPAGGGQTDGEKVLDILSTHPKTARFISGKLVRYFLGHADEKWTARLERTYLQTGGDLKAMLRPLVLSPDLLHSPPILKRPLDYVASSLRALNANTDGGKSLQDHLARMGQPLYQWPMPDGYPDKTSAWTGSLLARWNFAIALATGGIPGTGLDLPGLVHADKGIDAHDSLMELTLGCRSDCGAIQPFRNKLRAHLPANPTGDGHAALAQTTALCLASPAFQWR